MPAIIRAEVSSESPPYRQAAAAFYDHLIEKYPDRQWSFIGIPDQVTGEYRMIVHAQDDDDERNPLPTAHFLPDRIECLYGIPHESVKRLMKVEYCDPKMADLIEAYLAKPKPKAANRKKPRT